MAGRVVPGGKSRLRVVGNGGPEGKEGAVLRHARGENEVEMEKEEEQEEESHFGKGEETAEGGGCLPASTKYAGQVWSVK